MTVLIIAVIFGLWFTYFATQNTMAVTLQFGNYVIPGIPLYLVTLGALLTGLLISWVINILEGATSFFKLQSKDHSLHKMDHELNVLRQKVQDLEVENAELKGEHNTPGREYQPAYANEIRRPTLAERIKNKFKH